MTEALVIKSNALIEASYRLSLYEQRIMLACIAQVRRDEPLTDQKLYTVSAQQIAEMTGTKIGTAYQNLKAASERLFDRRVTLNEAPNGRGSSTVRLTRWVQEVVYQEAMGSIAMRFSTSMIPYLSQLTEQFTRYALSDVARMTSAHAIRLYELLVQWRSIGRREVEIEWLREAMQLEDRYSSIRDLKRWVLEPAIEQINEHSPLLVSWSQRKTGRKVTHLIFDYSPKTPNKPIANSKLTEKEIVKQARPGETWEQVRIRLSSE
ncbi:RepB family plasmid replication initiator protein [Pseudomonas sp. MF6754]|jgi:plasmid replication initiation protein|uniref:RepB family plasmid replication initiator protein n=1 Tax=Pseudomonas sp. MF6754 TaxID=2797529 RepID=UPI00190CEB28|nr:RepB family plasmid replication initiator protein [Pseudomonas sp. MF6754]MBK3457390.1 replication initiation protein [Pseudomonas sp. MF6754]